MRAVITGSGGLIGPQGASAAVVEELKSAFPKYRHMPLAAQPSHDKAADIPYDDFDVNVVGTMNFLVAARYLIEQVPLRYRYQDANRIGSHICYISDTQGSIAFPWLTNEV